MIDSNYIVFIRPEIIPYIEATEIFKTEKINGLDCIVCSKIHPSSPLSGFVDLTLPKIQEEQELEFVGTIHLQYIVHVCWVNNQTLRKIRGFHNTNEAIDTQH